MERMKREFSMWKALVYRQWYLGRKMVILGCITGVGISVLLLLVLLSFHYGNLALLPEEAKAMLSEALGMTIKCLPVIAFGSLPFVLAETDIQCDTKKWTCFRISTPATAGRVTFARYSLIIGMIPLYGLISYGFSCLGDSIIGEADHSLALHIILCFFAVCALFSVSMQVFSELFASRDKGGLCTMGLMVLLAAVFVACNKNGLLTESLLSDSEEEIFNLQRIQNLLEKVSPGAVVLLIITLVCGYISTYFLYRRREK